MANYTTANLSNEIKPAVEWAQTYTQKLGWALCVIPHGRKGPIAEGWNDLENTIRTTEQARKQWKPGARTGMGVVLGHSKLVAFDIDDVELTRQVLADFGVNLDVLLDSAPRLKGNPEREKLIFKQPQDCDLATHKLVFPPRENGGKSKTVFELRAGLVQDCLPPTIHPGTNKPYYWVADPLHTPPTELPAWLLELWINWASYKDTLCPWVEPPVKPPKRQDVQNLNVIGAFNQSNTPQDLLVRHGYKRVSKSRYLAPGSESGLAGVKVFKDGKVFSHHGGDPLADEHAHDAFDVYKILEHGGDQRQAVRAAAKELGMDKVVKLKNRQTKPETVPLDELTKEKPEQTENLRQSNAANYIQKKLTDFAYDVVGADWRAYRNGYWPTISKDYLLSAMRKIIEGDKERFPKGYTSSYLRGISDLFRYNVLIPENVENEHLLCFPNGVLNLRTRKFGPHDPKLFITWQLPFDYDPKATCKPIQDWLRDTFDEPSIVAVLRAYLNAVVNGRSDLHRFLELIGPGGSGKGTFLWLAESLVGEQNTFVTELKHLEQSRFETANILDKRLVVVTDSQQTAKSVDVLKALTGGDSIRLERKNVQGGSHFKPRAMVIIAANEFVQTPDYTSGLRRRRITVFANNPVPLNKQRPLQDEFAEYLPGLFNWVLDLPRQEVTKLLKSNAVSKAFVAAQQEALIQTNPLAAWLDANIVLELGAVAYVGTAQKRVGSHSVRYENTEHWLYPNYVQFCEETGVPPLSQHRFSKMLEDLCRNQIHLDDVHRGNRTMYGRPFRGLRLRRPQTDDLMPSPLDSAS